MTDLCFGVIADIQYADSDNGSNYHKTQIRHFRNTLEVTRRAMGEFEAKQVNFMVSLGDIIDGKNKRDKQSESALKKVLEVMQSSSIPKEDIHHVIGNHELYNFSRETLKNTLTQKGRYYSFSHANLRILVLDGYEISTCESNNNSSWRHQQAEQTLHANNINIRLRKHDFSAGLVGPVRRFSPYNGDISEEQFLWVEKTLEQSRQDGERVVVCCHQPVHREAASGFGVLMWSYQRMMALLEKYKGTVILYLAGHDHTGGSALSPAGIYHMTMQSPLNCDMKKLKDNYAIVHLRPSSLFIEGFGQVKSVSLPLDSPEEHLASQLNSLSLKQE